MSPFFMTIVTLAAFSSGVSSQTVLTQSESVLKRPREALKLTCAVTGFDVNTYEMQWIRQRPGKGLEWLVLYYRAGNSYYSPTIRGRFTASTDSSNLYLQMNNLNAEDTAVYYCAKSITGAPYGYFDYWGQGTQVTVSSAVPKAPTVFPLSPSGQDRSTGTEVSIGCLVQSYFPEPATVQWNDGAITTGIRTFPPVFDSSSYTHISKLTIPISRWESELFYCNVTHETTNSRFSQNVDCKSAPKDHDPVAPEVRLLHSSCDPKDSDGNLELLCIISGFYPKEITVEWLMGSQSGHLTSFIEPPRQNAQGYTFSTTSTVNISQADWLEGNTYHCQVTHAASQTKVKSRARKCQGDTSCPAIGISTFILPPTPRALYIERQAKLSCVVNNLESEEGLSITWSGEKMGGRTADPLQVTEELNGTYTAVSRLPISSHDWESGEMFTCSVMSPGLVVPIKKKISKVAGKTRIPKVFLFGPHPDEFNPGRQLTLSCLVSGFYPMDTDVQWLKNHNAMPDNSYVNTPAVKDDNSDSYFMYSKLSIPRRDWENQGLYTCMVTHEALPMKFTQRNVSKSQGKK